MKKLQDQLETSKREQENYEWRLKYKGTAKTPHLKASYSYKDKVTSSMEDSQVTQSHRDPTQGTIAKRRPENQLTEPFYLINKRVASCNH